MGGWYQRLGGTVQWVGFCLTVPSSRYSLPCSCVVPSCDSLPCSYYVPSRCSPCRLHCLLGSVPPRPLAAGPPRRARVLRPPRRARGLRGQGGELQRRRPLSPGAKWNTHTHAHICTSTHMHACAHTHIRLHACTYTCTHACSHMHKHAHTHLHA